MGVDAKIFIPAYVRVDDVGKVCTVLCGNDVKNFERENADFGSLIVLNFKDPCGESRTGHLFYEHDDIKLCGHKMLMPRSNFLWISLGRKLIEIFGGQIDYSDSDIIDVDYKVLPKNALLNRTMFESDKYTERQDIIKNLPPLSVDELELGALLCAYGKSDDFKESCDKFIEAGMKYLDQKIGEVANPKKRKCKKI